MKLFIYIVLGFLFLSCKNANTTSTNINFEKQSQIADTTIYPGIYDTNTYIELIENKRIAIIGNQTSIIANTHLVDTLLALDQNIVKVFCPEHGFRGIADAGEKIDDSTDKKTGLPIISLYGNNKKPSEEQLANIDIVIFDLQDVGVRFYTYISTLHYVMEACAENQIPLIVLDRPNPNGHYIDGSVLDTANNKSFIGMHPVPVVYGMTIGEYALMINGENWLNNKIKCELKIISCQNYTHKSKYSLPIAPSPNLPNDRSIELYPSLCLFEATNLSIGRGTDKQFQIIGHPALSALAIADFIFTPKPNKGASNPTLNGELCYGFDLSENYSIFEWQNDKLNINILLKLYKLFPDKDKFFKTSNSIDLLSGDSKFRNQVKNQISEKEIRDTWEDEIIKFKKTREKYLLYE
ncbi:MAG: DUF1343 domain-containing protein [Bacteroidales bacterium]|nr:DUF1343 domain-containing protein [Bacteroidales bacterium]MDY0142325.1 DUF1343 domain-containing protein [Bacteroidales bacterium]